jgi:hypothetical protein
MRRFSRPKYLTVMQQDQQMRARHPRFRSVTNRGNRILWTGLLQPTPRSDSYEVEIEYEVPVRPEVRILSPRLRIQEGCLRPPHTFEDWSLCVHEARDWNANILIALTIVPWICAWLYFYEVWLDTGAWLGGGTHPDLPQHRSDFIGSCAAK